MRIGKIKKISESTVDSAVAPAVGGTVRLDADPKYKDKTARILSDPEYRDSPIITVKDEYFDKNSFPGMSIGIHDELLRMTFIMKGWGPYYDYTGDVGFGYYLNDFLGQPTVILVNHGDYASQTNIVKANVPNAAVYVIANDTDLNRLAKRLIRKY